MKIHRISKIIVCCFITDSTYMYIMCFPFQFHIMHFLRNVFIIRHMCIWNLACDRLYPRIVVNKLTDYGSLVFFVCTLYTLHARIWNAISTVIPLFKISRNISRYLKIFLRYFKIGLSYLKFFLKIA